MKSSKHCKSAKPPYCHNLKLLDPFGSCKSSGLGYGLVMVVVFVRNQSTWMYLSKLPEYSLNCCWRHHSSSLLVCASGFLQWPFQICSDVVVVFQYLEAQFRQNRAILCFWKYKRKERVDRIKCFIHQSLSLFWESYMQIKKRSHAKTVHSGVDGWGWGWSQLGYTKLVELPNNIFLTDKKTQIVTRPLIENCD